MGSRDCPGFERIRPACIGGATDSGCPEWQRELTENQPSYDVEGSNPFRIQIVVLGEHLSPLLGVLLAALSIYG
jgi:hypothetical protein